MMTNTTQQKAFSSLFALAGILCCILHSICQYNLGVFADEFGRFSWTAFYGGSIWNMVDTLSLGLFILLALGGFLLSRMGTAPKAALLVYNCLLLALTVKIRCGHLAYTGEIGVPLWDVFGGAVGFALLLLECAVLLLCCILAAAQLISSSPAAAQPQAA